MFKVPNRNRIRKELLLHEDNGNNEHFLFLFLKVELRIASDEGWEHASVIAYIQGGNYMRTLLGWNVQNQRNVLGRWRCDNTVSSKNQNM